ncbi:hypothetical protein BDB01DRAFT_854338 [Pilobolus umbonatus]|nr:hypothetical protein BDB01DRAFT_854338 [Pilobolus umbonatus]
MNLLPNEILEDVIKDLGKDDIFSCLTVNKRFYSIFIKYFYKDIYLPDEDRAFLFLSSFYWYPRTREVGRYVKTLCAHKHVRINKQTVKIWANSLQKHFPNIEELIIRGSQVLAELLINTKKPILTRIKKLQLIETDCSREDVSDCLLKFRSTLIYLQFVYVDSLPRNFSVDDSRLYFASFPCLSDLFIDIKGSHLCGKLLFTDALNACPSLKSLCYNCITMNFNHHALNETQIFPQLRILFITTWNFNLNDARNIKHSLPLLENFTLEVCYKIEDEYNTIDTLLQMKIPNNITIIPPGGFVMATSSNFLERLGNLSKDQGEIMTIICENNILLKAAYNPKNNLRTIICPFHDPYNSAYKKFLDRIGKNVCVLKSSDYFHGTWNLEDFNKRCPMLTELKLKSVLLKSYNGKYTVNSHLTRLAIESSGLNILLLKDLKVCFPNLQELCLTGESRLYDNNDFGLNPSFQDPYGDHTMADFNNHNADIKEQIHYIYLNVHTFVVDQLVNYANYNIIVVKTKDDLCAKYWSYNSDSRRMVISEGRNWKHEIRSLEKYPLFLFIGEAIETVSLQLK